ncbi:nucleotidyltransferase family protein [Winogradskyella sp.]|uniref:nucleotidyltransferase family protein n=1 Tax=Winogradskyella sp. TaxID=1883156 RepID=UPI003F6C7580
MLKTQLQQFTDEDWVDLVKIGSSHLVLTTIYCRLQQKQLLHILPRDLVTYLHDLTAINRNRNTTIFKQIEALSQLLNANTINHVFLKGAAFLVAGYYNDFGERMVMDIDILIENTQLRKAAELIETLGYQSNAITFGLKYSKPHNDPLLIPKKEGIAAVELHRHVLHKYSEFYLSTPNLLANKRRLNGFYIPSERHILSHIILNFEINDYGFNQNRLGFRNAFDFICSTQRLALHELNDFGKTSKYHALFIAKTAYFFEDIRVLQLKSAIKIRFYFFKQSHENKHARAIHNFSMSKMAKAKKGIRFYTDIIKKTSLFITNTNYRAEAWQDRKRLIQLLKAKFFK